MSHGFLKVMSAAVWYVGAGVLLYKGSGYLVGAAVAGPLWPPILAGFAGATVGLLRGRTQFLKACRRNIARIEALERPRLWLIFRPVFFLALGLMFAAAAAFGWLAGTGYWGAVIVGGLEMIIGVALLTSSIAFWTPSAEPDPAGGQERERARTPAS